MSLVLPSGCSSAAPIEMCWPMGRPRMEFVRGRAKR